MIDWNPISKRLQYVLSLKPTPMGRLYESVCKDFRCKDLFDWLDLVFE